MNLSLILFTIGILGFVLNRKNIILMLISIEIMLLAITFLVLVSSLSFDDILGQTYAIYIIAIAGAESAIGLGMDLPEPIIDMPDPGIEFTNVLSA
jgi:NADH-ubiquinone oxidoreductase chain 4L